MQLAVVEKLKMPKQAISHFKVYIGSGDTLTCSQFCPKVGLCLQRVDFEIDLPVLPIKGLDIVLRIQWLQKLGQVYHD